MAGVLLVSNKRKYAVKIDIHYCTEWNYKPNAVSLADEIGKAFDVHVNLIPGSGGIFDVIADGDVIFSKFKTGRFPKLGEVAKKLQQ